MSPHPYAVVRTARVDRRVRGFTPYELRIVVAAQRRALARRNAAAMRRVAAGLPACVGPEGHCPAHNTREAVTPGRATASTTTTRVGGLSGCSSQSA